MQAQLSLIILDHWRCIRHFELEMSALENALTSWQEIVGTTNIITDTAGVASYMDNVSGLSRTTPAIIRPSCSDEVRNIVAIANQFKIALYPFSCGCNWGFGSRLPVKNDCALLDLSRMNKIIEVNVAHHYAVIEPGVTQGQLYKYIQENNLPLMINVTGASTESSLIGNALERGVGYFTSKADSLSGMEVILGNGTLLKCGFGHFKDAQTTYLYRYGIGPGLDSLFYQSNFGVVTKAAINLIPKPEGGMAMIARIDHEHNLSQLVDALTDLRQKEIIRTITHIGNHSRTKIAMGPLIFNELKRWMHASDHEIRRASEQLLIDQGFGPWSGVAGLLGTKGQLKDAKKHIRKRLSGIATLQFIDDQKIEIADRWTSRLAILPSVRKKRALLNAIKPLYGMARGIPSSAAMHSVTWPLAQQPHSENENPDHSESGLLFCVPFLPATGKAVREVVEVTGRTYGKYGFEPFITLNIIDGKALECVINMAFDKSSPQNTADAHACNDELTRECIRRGYPPYRMGIQSMDLITNEQSPFWNVVRDIKKSLDPNNIISPGRYDTTP